MRTRKVLWNAVAVLLLLLALGVLAGGGYASLGPLRGKAEPVEVALPSGFHGRVIRPGDISPGAFTIRRPFEEVSQWGEASLLSFSASGQSLSIRAWAPDESTIGVFKYAEKSYEMPWGRRHQIGEVVLQDGRLVALPSASVLDIVGGCVASVLGALLLLAFAGWAAFEH